MKSKNQATAKSMTRRHARGEVWVWLSAAGMLTTVLMLVGLLVLVTVNGLSALWPRSIHEFEMTDGSKALGELTKRNKEKAGTQIKTGNRDLYGIDFKWLEESEIQNQQLPDDVYVLERLEHGQFVGYLSDLKLLGQPALNNENKHSEFKRALVTMSAKRDELNRWSDEMADLNQNVESLRLALIDTKENSERWQRLREESISDETEFEVLRAKVESFRVELMTQKVVMTDVNGRIKEIALFQILRSYQPNQMSWFSRLGLYGKRMSELITEAPREANTEGGLFPAIFGTAIMVIIMSIFTMPLGVIAAVYLREYAKEGFLVRLVRITVNNLAGVPSIVYGMFGLGFFVYGIGGTIDEWFFSNRLPSPTFGTGGLLWASLTMALLTMPVVIVATEEGLSAVPKGLREGSLALGATKLQTLLRVVLPMSMPGMLTGLILAIARAAGEVAPLMLVGVAKLAANLVVDDVFPYFHPERKFMHLGFHIYDVGFQSPNVEAAIPMVFVTTLLLLVMVLGLSGTAMVLRQRMRSRYTSGAF